MCIADIGAQVWQNRDSWFEQFYFVHKKVGRKGDWQDLTSQNTVHVISEHQKCYFLPRFFSI